MSTRCNVHVEQEGMMSDTTDKSTVQLYHHCDGYPSSMIPLLQAACKKTKGWEAGRSGKLAVIIAAEHPGGYDLESQVSLHGDIEYFYRVTTVNTTGGSMDEEPKIYVEVYTSHGIKLRDKFWKSGNPNLLRCIQKRKLLSKVDGENIEKNEDKS